jgi:hypothetical protein
MLYEGRGAFHQQTIHILHSKQDAAVQLSVHDMNGLVMPT